MRESIDFVMGEYRWEKKLFSDIDRGMDFDVAQRVMKVLQLKFHTRVGLQYFTDHHDRLAGCCLVHDFDWGRTADIFLYAPHSLRTLGHEYCHALRWIRKHTNGHGDTWREDLKLVHEEIRKLMPVMFFSRVKLAYIGRYAIVPVRIRSSEPA